jgi:hypothetical protein
MTGSALLGVRVNRSRPTKREFDIECNAVSLGGMFGEIAHTCASFCLQTKRDPSCITAFRAMMHGGRWQFHRGLKYMVKFIIPRIRSLQEMDGPVLTGILVSIRSWSRVLLMPS